MIGVTAVFLAGFAWYSWVAERKYVVGNLAAILRYSVQNCEMYFQRVENQHRILGIELLREHPRVSAEKAMTMLNNYKGINQDQRWFALLAGDGEPIAETDVAQDERRPYFLSEIPSRDLPRDLLEHERLEFERPEDGIFDLGLVMPFRYTVRDAAGAVKYIVRSRLRLGALQELWRTMLVPQESTLGIVHRTGYLISRYSANPGVESKNRFGFDDAEALDSHMKAEGYPHDGFVVLDRAAPGVRLLVVYQRMLRYPATVFVSVPVSFVKSGWRARTRAPFALAALALLGELAICRLMLQKIRAERRFSRKQAELKGLTRNILEAQEQERQRLSHELHDEVGQSLTALKIMLSRARASLPDAGKTDELLTGSQRMLESMVGSVREIAHRLRPAELDQIGLAAALRLLVDKTIRPAFQNVTLFENIGGKRFSRDLELCCFRVAQEALTNSLRHARAGRIDISLTHGLFSRLTLIVTDDGVGFDAESYRPERASPGALGVVGMRERVTANGGILHIRSRPEGGVEVKATFENVEEIP
jgi:signal transduction histidine kinase